MIYIAPVHPDAQRRLTTSLASIGWQEHVGFWSSFERKNSFLNSKIRRQWVPDWWSGTTKSSRWGLTVWHELMKTTVTFRSRSTNLMLVDQQVSKITRLTKFNTLYVMRAILYSISSWLAASVAVQADRRRGPILTFATLHEQNCSVHVAIWLY